MHNQTKTILALLALTALAAVAYAQSERGPGEALPSAFDVIMQINDARAAAGFGPNYTLCKPWEKSLGNFPPYKFAAGKNFTLIIRETARSPQYPNVFQDYRVSAVANATGFVTFNINVPAGVNVTKPTDWYVAIVVEWPRPGYYFLIYNQTFKGVAFIDVIGNLSGRPELAGTNIYTGPWGVIRVKNGAGRFGNLSSSVIHTFYVGVNTLGKPFSLTFTRTVTIGGTTITLDDNVGPARGPTNYVKGFDPKITSVFGPFTYLATYVSSFGTAGKDDLKVDTSQVYYNHYVYISIEGSRGVVIQSKNDKFNVTYTDPTRKYNLTHVAITLNMTTGATVPMSCGLVIWNINMYTVNITGLLDLKGNPIFNPEHFRFKIQMKVGDNWVTLDRAQGSWKLSAVGVAGAALGAWGVLKALCNFDSLSELVDNPTLLLDCIRGMNVSDINVMSAFRRAVLRFYDTVTLARLGGQLQLTNNDARVSTADLTTKLVVEYSYTAGQDTVKAIVLEVALAEPANFQGVLNVSVLPVQIRLWRWSNYSLPPTPRNVTNPREYFYTDPLDLASLRFVVEGDTMYVNRMAYDGAISYDPWLGQVVWTLPPYQPIPGVVGNVRASLLTLFNASGYLPMPPLVGNLTRGGKIQYFNYTDVARRADFFKQFMIGLVGSYSYKFRIYSGDTRVGTANIVAYYPVINSSGLMFHSKADETLQAEYGDKKKTDMYAVRVVEPVIRIFDREVKFYDREHVIHIAIARVFQNILMRDACGNPVVGIRAGLAGASISLVMNIDGRNVTIARLPVGSEVPVDIMVPIDEWGEPQLDLSGDFISAYAVLNYFGYTLYPVDDLSKIPANKSIEFRIPVKFGVVRKPVLYLPIAPLNFRVRSQVVSDDYDPLEDPLAGFVVRVFSTGGTEIARSISNKDGYAYAPSVPIGVPIRVQVRTIVPSSDRRWSYTYEQISRSNDYASYAKFMGIPPSKDVYTLGTRGAIDSGLVVYDSRRLLDASNATKYICARDAIDLPVEVYDLVVRVFDKTGKYLLRSQPVFFGPYPQATRPFLLNVTLVLADDYSPYDRASIWRDYSVRDFKVLTDFRAIGITGMRSIYLGLASRYLDDAKRALGCPHYTAANYSRAINSYALATMAGFVANASTDRYAAVFLLTSQQPKDVIDLCKMKPSEAGTAEIARLFMKGQRFRFVVWYMGQKVFDDYVTITGPLVDIKADVYPINVTTYTKSMRLPVDTFVGFTLTDVYVGLALNKTDGMFVNKTLVPQLISPFTSVYGTYSLAYLLVNELVKNTSNPFNINVTAFVGGEPSRAWYYGRYKPVTFGGDFVYLPNIVVLRNATTPKYQFTVLNNDTKTTMTYRTLREENSTSGSLQVPAGQVLRITLRGAQIVPDPANNATYLKLTSYNGTEDNVVVQPQLTISGDLVIVDGRYIKDYLATIDANYTIVLSVNASCGSISVAPAPGDIAVDITVNAGRCTASVGYVATYRSYNYGTIIVTSAPSSEYAVSFDRWFLVPYDSVLGRYNVLYHASGVVNRTAVLWVLSHNGTTTKCATLKDVTRVDEDDKYTYELMLRGVEVVNYRTLEVVLPWKTAGGGKAIVNITAYNITSNGKAVLLGFRVYNLTDMLAGSRGTRVVVTLPLNFGKVVANAYNITTKKWTIKYVIEFQMYDPRDRPISVCATKLVPLAANYTTVSMYECGVSPAPGVPERIDPTTVVYAINRTASILNGFDRSYDAYGGFGTPITYVVRSGEIALLPSWYHKTAVAGSRIARIWIIAASDDPSRGPALGTKYYASTVKDDKVSINIYKFEKYLVVNYVPNVCPAGWTTQTFLDEFDGSGRIIGLGFGTSGTSALVLSSYTKVQMWNSTAMWLAGGVFRLPTVALGALTVQNTADFPIVVGSLTVKYRDDKYSIPMSPFRVDSGKTGTALLNGYGFGRTYMFNVTDVWAFKLVQPNYEYNVGAYHAGLYDAARHFGLGEVDVTKYLRPLESKYYVQNVLYASHAETSDWTFKILNGKITEITRGRWGDLTVRSNDTDYKYVFSFPTLPLREIRDWNDRPLANQTIALFDRSGRLYAVVYSDSRGRLVYPLPDISAIGQANVVRVAWYNGYLVELLRGRPEFTIWIYDQLISRDVTELGDASATSKIRTYVYPLTMTVKDDAGRPLTNMYVRVVDTSTVGQLVNAVNVTGADGGAQVIDLRISKYSSGVLSQVPGTSYYYYVYDPSGALVATGKFELTRGASVPATGWNVLATVRYATEIPVKNSATRGFILIKGVEFLNGTRKDVRIPFTVSGGVMTLGGKVPVSVEYPVDIYVTHVTLRGQEVPVKGGQYLVFSGKTTDLLSGLDFAELGLTGLVTIQAVDAAGTPRSDWTVQVLYGNITAAQGQGQLQAVLPRTDVLGDAYKIKVITNAVTPEGKALVKEQTLTLNQKALALQIPVSTVKVTLQAVDGFGAVRNDWPVVIENVATGMGQLTTELVEGQQYVARVTALGFTNTTTFVARGPQMVMRVKIPTAKIEAQVVDGFGVVRNEWSVQIVGVVSGQGKVGPVEVLGGQQYTVKTAVFGKEFSQTVNVPVGQTVTATVQVPTAKLSVTAVDDDKRPIDNYVSSVELTGPLNLMYSKPPKDVEVLAGTYNIKVVALGKEAPGSVTLNPGDTKNIQIVVPGTAGLDFLGSRIPLPTLVLYAILLLVIILILAILIIEYNNWRRRRLMQILAPPK